MSKLGTKQDSQRARYLFISSAWREGAPLEDASTLYRCIFHVLNLRASGHIADFVPERELRQEFIEYYDRFIFHRPTYSEHIKRTIGLIISTSKHFCCDYDDLIFDEASIMSSPRRLSGHIAPEQLYDAALNNQKAMGLFSDVIVSTQPLAQKVRALGPYKVNVIYNGYQPYWLRYSESSIEQSRAKMDNNKVKIISYFSGSASHDDDFRQLIEPLSEVMRVYPEVTLQLVGPLKVPADAFPAGRVFRRDLVPYLSLPNIMATTWLTLAPLNLARDFNKCKSGLKFFEAGIFGIPCAATLSEDMKRFSGHVLGLERQSDLLSIVKRYSDEAFYRAESIRIRKFALENCSSMQQTRALHELFEATK
ncbi:hypothetical protein [Asticcacaulis sp.]|uniref:hypothetical protein n=1 Tax=Asticcacaulis sp. TaxID=1872648 RepID=UPI002B5C619D|nr:hypothetical protein [Asticcacaulis sp.]HTM81129.1 hypothetical protein [Asticcacaulis sp.]